MMSRSSQIYEIDGGNKRKVFLKDTEVGWKKVLGNAKLHVSGGRTCGTLIFLV